MKIIVYELLGMVKDGKIDLDTKIKIDNVIIDVSDLLGAYIFNKKRLNDEVEIIEEYKIPDKLDYCNENTFIEQKETTYLSQKERILLDSNFKELGNKINEIINYLDYLKRKGI